MLVVYEFQDLRVDPQRRALTKGGQRIALPELSFDLLIHLLEVAPAPLTFDEMASQVWKAPHVSPDTIAQRVALLRKAIGDDPKAPDYIRTVRGSGYAAMGDVRQCPLSADRGSPKKKRWLGTQAIGLGAVAGSALSGAALWSALAGPEEGTADTPRAVFATKDEVDVLVSRANEQLQLHQPAETQRAIKMLRAALIQNPRSFDARLTLSFALSTSATKFEGGLAEKQEAEALARSLIEDRPEASSAWSALGYSLSSQARPDEALTAYRRAFEIDPTNASALSSAAHILLLKGELQQALLLEMRARERGGRSKYAEIQIAQVLELVGHEAAQSWRDQAIALNPGQAVVIKEIAAHQIRNGQPREALKTISEYDGDPASAPQLLEHKGRALLALDRRDEARSALRRSGWRGHFLLAAMDAEEGKTGLAHELFTPEKREQIADTSEPQALVQLAEVDAALGDIDQSAQWIAQAVNTGWRDADWLKRSRYLAQVINTNRGKRILDRISRDLASQMGLIENTQALDPILIAAECCQSNANSSPLDIERPTLR